MYNSLCGASRESVLFVLQDSMKRISILQHLSPQYFFDNGELINGLMKAKMLLPNISAKMSSSSSKEIPIQTENKEMCSRISSSSVEGATYGNCGRFERRMCRILDSIELARAEITGKQAIKLPNGRIQYISEKQIRERKAKEDLQTVSACLNLILNEICEHGTFEVLINYVKDKNDAIMKMAMFSIADKECEREITALNQNIERNKVIFNDKKAELMKLIQHFKHQKQELIQKRIMENLFVKHQTHSQIEELKMNLSLVENQIIDEYKHTKDLMEQEEKVNIQLSMFLRNSIQVMEQNIEYWAGVHSIESAKAQTRIKNQTKEYQQLIGDLESLVAKYVSYETVCIQDRKDKVEKAKLDEIEAFATRKALMIQNWWRYICVMMSIGPHAPKKKGKKGKGKGKEKGKGKK